MEMVGSRTKKSLLILLFSGVRQMLTFVLAFVSRSVFIYVLGAEYLGVNGLFTNILQFLSLAELGIGAAITYYLYKPLAENDIERIKVVIKFYRNCYRAVGLAILCLGCLLMPFLDRLVNLEQAIPENIYFIYFLFLCNSAFTYLFFAYKQTLVMANQEQYKIEKINIVFTFINCLADIIVLLIFRNFIIYLLSKILLVIVKNIIISFRIDREYPYIKEPCSGKLSKEEIKKLFNDVYSVFVFRVGTTMINSVTNIFISVCISTVVVGYYSNYALIVSSCTIAFQLVVNSFVAGIGNVMATENAERQYSTYQTLNFITFALYSLIVVCLFELSNSFINVWLGHVGQEYVLSQVAVIAICLNFYLDSSSQIINAFRNGAGRFEVGRNLTIFGGIMNITLSFIGAKLFGLEGILFAPPLSKLFVTIIPFFILIGKKVFGKSVKEILTGELCNSVFTAGVCALVWLLCRKFHQTDVLNFVFEIMITIAVFITMFYLFYRNTRQFAAAKDRIVNYKLSK